MMKQMAVFCVDVATQTRKIRFIISKHKIYGASLCGIKFLEPAGVTAQQCRRRMKKASTSVEALRLPAKR
jgi:hypothetical protein